MWPRGFWETNTANLCLATDLNDVFYGPGNILRYLEAGDPDGHLKAMARAHNRDMHALNGNIYATGSVDDTTAHRVSQFLVRVHEAPVSTDKNRDSPSDVKAVTEQTLPRVHKSTDRASHTIVELGAAYAQPVEIAAISAGVAARPGATVMPRPWSALQTAWEAMSRAGVNCSTAARIVALNAAGAAYAEMARSALPDDYLVVPFDAQWAGVRTGVASNSSGGLEPEASWKPLLGDDHTKGNDTRISYRAPESLLDTFSAMVRTNYMA